MVGTGKFFEKFVSKLLLTIFMFVVDNHFKQVYNNHSLKKVRKNYYVESE